MTYADPTTVQERLKALETDVNTETLTEVINAADITINAKLEKAGLTPPTTTVEKLTAAGNLLAVADALDILYNTVDNRSPTAKRNEERADELIGSYIAAAIEEQKEATYGTPIGIFTVYDEDQMEIDEEEEEEEE